MKSVIAALLILVAVPFHARSADGSAPGSPSIAGPAERLQGKRLEQWTEQLGSERFSEREEALNVLSGAGEGAIPALKKALESSDYEVHLRAQMALAALKEVSIDGEFLRINSESFTLSGRPTTQLNETGESTLRVSKGRVIFIQEYNKGIEQVYSFAETIGLTFRNKCAIPLNWESINKNASYNPDNGEPKLECVNTPQGLRLTLSATDTGGTSFRMTYAPKADVEKERAEREKLKIELNAR